MTRRYLLMITSERLGYAADCIVVAGEIQSLMMRMPVVGMAQRLGEVAAYLPSFEWPVPVTANVEPCYVSLN